MTEKLVTCDCPGLTGERNMSCCPLPSSDGGEATLSDKEKGRPQAALLDSAELYCFGQGWTFISGPRSYGGGTWASVVTWLDRAQSKERLKRAQNSLSVGAR